MDIFPQSALNKQEFSDGLQSALENGGILLPYSGWLGHDNVGDEIVFDLLCCVIQRALNGAYTPQNGVAVPRLHSLKAANMHAEIDWTKVSGAVLGGGSTIDKFYIRRIQPALEARLPVFCFAAGYQKDDDLSDDDRASIGRLSAARYGSVRGHASKQMLEQLAGPSPVTVTVDGGFLAPVFYPLLPIHAGRLPRMVVNLLNIEYTHKMLLEIMEIYKNDYEFILLPFDDSTLTGLSHLRDAAPPGCQVRLETDFTNYSKLLSWYAASDLSLNMKLHASVLSSSVGTPPLGWNGGRKMEEYFTSIGSESFRVHSFKAEDLRQGIEQLRHQKRAYQPRMRTLLNSVLQTHLTLVNEFLRGPELGPALAKLGNSINVTGVKALDCGFILLTGAG